jgi:hypothetical protein
MATLQAEDQVVLGEIKNIVQHKQVSTLKKTDSAVKHIMYFLEIIIGGIILWLIINIALAYVIYNGTYYNKMVTKVNKIVAEMPTAPMAHISGMNVALAMQNGMFRSFIYGQDMDKIPESIATIFGTPELYAKFSVLGVKDQHSVFSQLYENVTNPPTPPLGTIDLICASFPKGVSVSDCKSTQLCHPHWTDVASKAAGTAGMAGFIGMKGGAAVAAKALGGEAVMGGAEAASGVGGLALLGMSIWQAVQAANKKVPCGT